jgi:UPF0176 protein
MQPENNVMSEKFRVTALYKFVALADLEDLQRSIRSRCNYHRLTGTILLAHEGINGTIAGEAPNMADFLAWLMSVPEFADLDYKQSWASTQPFLRMKVRLKSEIVALGVDGVDPTKQVGIYVMPEDWNALIDDPDVLLVDTRNDYEVSIGTFDGAVNPNTVRFRDLPAWMEENFSPDKSQKIAMFCTGGIRCEKSTALAKHMGYDQVFHLKGGILKYLENVPAEESRWQGECFVFDQRVSVKHGLEEGNYVLCHACRQPLDEAALASADYVPGVQCPHCVDTKNDEQLKRYRERQKQIELAKSRGDRHLGS